MHRPGPRNRFAKNRFESLEERLALSAAPPAVVDVAVASSQWNGLFGQYLEDNALGDDGAYTIPTGSNQDVSIPWVHMDRIRIRFSEDVYVDAADLSVSGVNNASYEFSDFSYDPLTDTAEWVLATPIGNDRIMLDLDAGGADPVRDLDGNALDGEWTDSISTGSSGNGVAGGDFEFSIQFLPGDVSDERTSASLFDRSIVDFLMGQTSSDPGYLHYADVDGDGLIGISDWLHIDNRIGDAAPTGLPAAATSDAPTTSHFALVDIDDDSVDVAISLFDVFDDEEDTDSQLTFTVKSVSDPSLLDSHSIDSVTGSLIVNAFTPPGGGQASGRTEITVVAEDSSGQTTESTVTIDVHRDNASPTLTAISTHAGRNAWTISGWITDSDDDLDRFWVLLGGAFTALVSVAEDGYFSYTSTIPIGGFTEVFVTTNDPHGASAAPMFVYIGW